MRSQLDLAPVARLDFVGQGAENPGWYIRYSVNGRPTSERLSIEIGADAFGAVELAADHLGCRVDQIEFGGPVWPVPLDGLVPAEGTLEFMPDPESDAIDSGDWHCLTGSLPGSEFDARRSERLSVEGIRLRSPALGRVLNWSEFGMGIEIGRPLIVDSRRLFKAHGKRSHIDLLGEVRWCHIVEGLPLAHKSGPIYRAGVTLIA
jgi:hypothetical protein